MKHIKLFEEFKFNMSGEGTLSSTNLQNVKKAFQASSKGNFDEAGSEFEVKYTTDPDTKYIEYLSQTVKARTAIEAFLKLYDKEGYEDTDLEGDHAWKKTRYGWKFELEPDDSDSDHIFTAYVKKIS